MRKCSECNEDIPIARLKAIPSAEQCVPCLTAMGDVPALRRYDEAGQDCDTVSTFYVKSNYIEDQQRRSNNFIMPDKDYEDDVDKWFTKPVEHVGGYSMAEAFEEDEDDNS